MNKKEKDEFLKRFDGCPFDAEAIYKETYSKIDPDWKIKFFKELLKKADHASQYIDIAASIAETLEDIEWAKEVYLQATKAPIDSWEYRLLGDEVSEYLNDEKWAEELHAIADKMKNKN